MDGIERRLLWQTGLGDGGEGEVLGGGVVLAAPEVEEPSVAEGDVPGRIDAQAGGGAVDPFGGAFEFGVVADGGFVEDAVALPVCPLAAPFFVAEGSDQAEGEKDLGEGIAVGDLGFGFDAVLVGVFAGANVGKTLVGQEAAACVGADAENLSAGAHPAVGSVVEDVRLEAAGGLQSEPCGFKAAGEAGQVVHSEFDFGFDGHGQQ